MDEGGRAARQVRKVKKRVGVASQQHQQPPPLPLDVWAAIARHCDNRTLASLALVSRSLHMLAREAMDPVGHIAVVASDLPKETFGINARLLTVHADIDLPSAAKAFAAAFIAPRRATRLRLTSNDTAPKDLGVVVAALNPVPRDRLPELQLCGPIDCGTCATRGARVVRRMLVCEQETMGQFVLAGDLTCMGQLFEGLGLTRVRGPLPMPAFVGLERLVLADCSFDHLILSGLNLHSLALANIDCASLAVRGMPLLHTLTLAGRPTLIEQLADCPLLKRLCVKQGAAVFPQSFFPPCLDFYETVSAPLYALPAVEAVITDQPRPLPSGEYAPSPGLRRLSLHSLVVPSGFATALSTTLVELHAFRVDFLHPLSLGHLAKLRVLTLDRCQNIANLRLPVLDTVAITDAFVDLATSSVLCRFFGARRLTVDYGLVRSVRTRRRMATATFGGEGFAVEHLALRNLQSAARIPTSQSLISLEITPHPDIARFAKFCVGTVPKGTKVLVELMPQPSLRSLRVGGSDTPVSQAVVAGFVCGGRAVYKHTNVRAASVRSLGELS